MRFAADALETDVGPIEDLLELDLDFGTVLDVEADVVGTEMAMMLAPTVRGSRYVVGQGTGGSRDYMNLLVAGDHKQELLVGWKCHASIQLVHSW